MELIWSKMLLWLINSIFNGLYDINFKFFIILKKYTCLN